VKYQGTSAKGEQAGAIADASEEPVACHGAEPGSTEEAQAWTEAGRAELEKLELLPYAAERRKQLLQALDGLEAEIEQLNRRVEAEVAQRPAAVKLQTHPGVGPVTALAMDAGTGRAVSVGQGSGKLLRTDSQRAFQRRQAAVGPHQQTGQFVSALSAGGSGPDGGTLRRGVRTLLSSPGGAQTSRSGLSGGGAQAGIEVVPDVARRLDVRATMQGGRAGEPESSCGQKQTPTA
jgi:hypothetical protein